MKNINKILIATLISVSLFQMIEADVFHHHIDNGQHNECPICILNNVISTIAILFVSTILFKPIFSFDNAIPVNKTRLIQNYSSYYCPDRAPPRV